jgi:hypothetical protein
MPQYRLVLVDPKEPSVPPVSLSRRNAVALAVATALCPNVVLAQAVATQSRRPDVHFVPTPDDVVDAMLEVAKVSGGDVLYDLGSGDGRIPIAAAKKFGTRGVGIDIDPERIKEANANLKSAGVADKVRFIQGDLFQQDLSQATVITLYLLPALNLKLRPTLFKLKPGTRIVSHDFDMGDWKPEQTLKVGRSTVYLWRVPTPAEAARIEKNTRT